MIELLYMHLFGLGALAGRKPKPIPDKKKHIPKYSVSHFWPKLPAISANHWLHVVQKSAESSYSRESNNSAVVVLMNHKYIRYRTY
jgi:hypothetical protein